MEGQSTRKYYGYSTFCRPVSAIINQAIFCSYARPSGRTGLHRRRRASEIGVDLKPNHTTEEGLMESLKFGVIFLVMLACVYLLGGGR